MGEQKFCASCGVGMPQDAGFCPSCGSKQQTNSDAVASNEQSQAVNSDLQPKTDLPQVYPAPAASNSNQALSQPVQPVQQYNQAYQPSAQAPQHQQPLQEQAAPPKKTRKFPWVFAIAWAVMLVFVGIWTYCYMDSSYDRPILTGDTMRVVTYVVSIVLLIYTLHIMLLAKKFKIFPTIILILSLLLSFAFYTSYELVEGEFLHDIVSPVTDSIFPDAADSSITADDEDDGYYDDQDDEDSQDDDSSDDDSANTDE